MGLLDDLCDGELGVRLQLGDDIEVLDDHDHFARWVVPDLELTALAIRRVFPLDLSDARKPSLRAEIEAEARRMFEREHRADAQSNADGPLASRPPRTDDSSWSPIVELELLERDDGRLLRCIHRLAYRPGRELVRGALCCPVDDGQIVLALLHLAKTTGARESVLMLGPLANAEGTDLSSLHPGQAVFDAPEHDPKFPRHGLTRVRAGLAGWLSPDHGALTITRPAAALTAGQRIELPACGSSIELPVGFLPLRPGSLPMSPTLSTLARFGIDDQPDVLLDIWRVTDARVRDADELIELADHTAEGWAEEGATDVEVTTKQLPSSARGIEVRSRIAFRVKDEPTLNLAHWILADDGAVFRIGVGFQPPDRFEDWEPRLDAVVRTWERLPEPRRSWWRGLLGKR